MFAHLVGAATSRDPVAFLSAARETIIAEGHSVIGVDDAHLLDQLSATLLHQLALDGTVRIVATVRTGESVPDAITSLWKDGYLQRLHLTPFTKEPVRRADRGGTRRPGGGAVRGPDVGGVRRQRAVRPAPGRGRAGGRHAAAGARGVAAARPHRRHLRTGLAAGHPRRSAARRRAARAAAADVLRTARPRHVGEIVGDDAVEEAEKSRTDPGGRGPIDGVDVRFNHPLFGEVIRRRLGMAAARRLRGELVRALQGQPLRSPADRIRLAELTLDSDQAPDLELLVTAARDAIALTNVTLGERLARAAVNRGGGLVASELLARSLLWQGNAAEAEETLSAFDPDQMNELDLTRWGMARIANLHWSMGDAESADEVLELLRCAGHRSRAQTARRRGGVGVPDIRESARRGRCAVRAGAG